MWFFGLVFLQRKRIDMLIGWRKFKKNTKGIGRPLRKEVIHARERTPGSTVGEKEDKLDC